MKLTSPPTRTHAIAMWLWYWLPPILWMAAIFYFSSQPTLPGPRAEWLDALLKKLAHATEYAALFLLFWRAWRPGRAVIRALDTAWLSTAAYAVSDELHQAFVPGRHANGYDVAIDVSGALVLWWLLRRKRRRGFLETKDHDLTE